MNQTMRQTKHRDPRWGWGIKPFLPVGVAAGLVFLLVTACPEPVPLYGKWADNFGDSISFFDDGTFNAVIINEDKDKLYFDGTYTVLQNALTLLNSDDNRQIVTEWDIRGNMLYLNWPTENGTISLTLFKISN
jgi:hypothetical protein